MSKHKSTRLRSWTSLLILLHLIAVLLPAGTARAAVQGTNCPDSSLAARAAAVVPAANQQVIIPKEIVDFSVFQANWLTRYKDADALQQFLFAEMMGNMQAIRDGERMYNILNDWQTRVEQAVIQAEATDRTLLPYEAIIHIGLDEALKIPELASGVPLIWEKIVSVQDLAQQGLTDTARIVQSGKRYDLGARILALAPNSVFTVFDCARKNSAIAIVFDRLNSDTLNASITDSAETILGNNPDLVIPTEIRGRINNDGTVSFSIEELKGLTAAEFEQIHTSIGEIQDSLIEIDKQQDVIIDYIKDQELKAKYQELVKKKAAEHQLKVDAAKASVSILSTIIGQIDPKLGKQVGTIGNSSIQVYEALNGWLKAVAGLKGLDKVF